MPPLTSDPPTFPMHLERSIQRVRGALTDLLTAVGADPEVPQELARRFAVNKNLAWKACRIVRTADAAQVVPHLPGAAGFEILLEALRSHGAPDETVERTREALLEFDRMVELHAGDRATLELMLGSMQAGESLPEASRRLAFQGNSAVFGVQARVRVGAQLLAPAAGDASLLDVAILGGVLDFRRLRPTATWPVAREVHSSEESPTGSSIEPIDPASASEPLGPVLREFSTDPLPKLQAVPIPGGTVYELGEGPVGNTAAATCVFGWILRRFAPLHGTEEDSRGEYFLRLDVPAERLLFDLLVHRDLPFEGAPELDLYSLMQGRFEMPLSRIENQRLPRVARVESLGGGPPVLATPHSPRHAAMIGRAAERLGRDLEEFRGYRLTLTYPPIPALAVFHYELPLRAGS